MLGEKRSCETVKGAEQKEMEVDSELVKWKRM